MASMSAAAYSGYIGGGIHMGKHKFNATYDNWNDNANGGSGGYDSKKDNFSASGSGIILKLGQYIVPNLAIEAHFVGGLSGDSISWSDPLNPPPNKTSYNSDIDFKSAWGLFAKPMGFISDTGKVYGLLGYGGVDFDIDTDDSSFKSKSPSSGIAYGLGFESEVEYGVFLGAEYVSYLDHADGSYDSFSVFLSMYIW